MQVHEHKELVPRRPRRRDRREDNVVPMINIVFLLLLFFMVAGRLAPDSGAEVRPPASASEAPLPRGLPEIVIHADGAMRFRGRELAAAELAERLLVDGVPPAAVRLRADAEAAAGTVTAVVDRLAALGVERLLLATTRAR